MGYDPKRKFAIAAKSERGGKTAALSEEQKKAHVAAQRKKKAAVEAQRKKAEAQALEKANAQRLAQIVNLVIGGYSLTEIGHQIGATAEEVDRLLQRDAARYVRSQPQLRVFVRNWISAKYTEMLEADAEAFDPNSPHKLENQDRVIRILDSMRRLHGADAPVQSEVKVEAAPETVEKMVQVLSAAQGVGYDADIFDVVDAEVVEEISTEAHRALEVSGNAVGETVHGEDEDL